MDISIVIVNYNVKHFLEQCLHSVFKSVKAINSEVFVVDNNSVDGSCQMVREKFPQVKLIENKFNAGFSKANNQAIKQAIGRYILLLNPDTFVQEDTLKKCIDFCDAKTDIGGLGVKMIDGKGEFLPESKRALPTPLVAFYKIFGLSALFPKSKTFGKYHLGYLDKDKNHEVEVLAGAFMMLRKSVLDTIGLLDETFFMYGEDIDLSYRILKAGFKNYYFSDTAIIHYKGESTKKGSINYVMVFYKAMIIFAQKHFTKKRANLYSILIHFAIYFRAALGIIRRVVLATFEPIMDALFIYLGFYFFTPLWELYKSGQRGYYPPEFFTYVIPAYVLIWMFFIYFAGGYDKKIKLSDLIKGTFWGSVAIVLIYSFLPESLRFSRALILLGTIWVIISVFRSRLIGTALFSQNRKLLLTSAVKRIVTVGSVTESERVLTILKESKLNFEFIGRVNSSKATKSKGVLGHIEQLGEIIKINKVDEIIFCSQDLTAASIIEAMLLISNPSTEFKIAPPESISVIGSSSIHTTGDLYVIDMNSLTKGVNKRKKRLFDIMSAVVLFVLSPLMIILTDSPIGLLRNIFLVIYGRRTWVGLAWEHHHIDEHSDFKKGILTPDDGWKKESPTELVKERLNIMYVKNYSVLTDITIMFRAHRSLGRS
ncbi:MAG TPA: glycosyl transferase family 2 [Bacteroidales bacterium]|nr:glycosyl transferase family 2 [Bacteroidales bacterium]